MCEYEVTVTSWSHTHKQSGSAERSNKQSRLHALEARTKTPTQGMVLKHGGVTDARAW